MNRIAKNAIAMAILMSASTVTPVDQCICTDIRQVAGAVVDVTRDIASYALSDTVRGYAGCGLKAAVVTLAGYGCYALVKNYLTNQIKESEQQEYEAHIERQLERAHMLASEAIRYRELAAKLDDQCFALDEGEWCCEERRQQALKELERQALHHLQRAGELEDEAARIRYRVHGDVIKLQLKRNVLPALKLRKTRSAAAAA